MNRYDRPARQAPRYARTEYKKNQKKHSTVRIIRALIQLAAFLLIPGLFITVLSGIGAIYTAIIGGAFVLSEQIVNILLVTAVLLLTVIWGRFFCGYICSFGAMQDLLRAIGKRLVKRNIVPEKADRVLKFFKYAVLLFIVAGVWTLGVGANLIWSPWTVFGMYASPLKGFPTGTAFLSIGGALLLVIIIGSLFIDRFFCRYACPLGAIFALLSRFRIFRIKKPSSECGRCRMCSKSCPMAIPLYKYDEIISGECINCMNCTAACHRSNVRLETLPAVSGTVAAMALAGVVYAGTLPAANTSASDNNTVASFSETAALGQYKDGEYTGSAEGFRGTTSVRVTVSSGNITDITVESSGDDRQYLSKAEDGVIPDIISNQSTDVDTVSGATYSSRGIINAVEDAIGSQKLSPTEAAEPAADAETEHHPSHSAEPTEAEETEAVDDNDTDEDVYAVDGEDTYDTEDDADDDDENHGSSQGLYTDGVYTGYGSGFRGTTAVSVTVEGGNITDITVISYQDDYQFFSRAEYGVIANILAAQSVDVSTVSGATFSSNSIKEAVADALGLAFTNPNSSMGGGHGHH